MCSWPRPRPLSLRSRLTLTMLCVPSLLLFRGSSPPFQRAGSHAQRRAANCTTSTSTRERVCGSTRATSTIATWCKQRERSCAREVAVLVAPETDSFSLRHGVEEVLRFHPQVGRLTACAVTKCLHTSTAVLEDSTGAGLVASFPECALHF